MTSNRIITVEDKARILEEIQIALGAWSSYAPNLHLYRRELERAIAVPAAEVPRNVITMHSRFALTSTTDGGTRCHSLVYPREESPLRGDISVLSPMGMALLGAAESQEVCWLAPDGPDAARVDRVLLQPEFRVPRSDDPAAAFAEEGLAGAGLAGAGFTSAGFAEVAAQPVGAGCPTCGCPI